MFHAIFNKIKKEEKTQFIQAKDKYLKGMADMSESIPNEVCSTSISIL
jgi:hypothetical protein